MGTHTHGHCPVFAFVSLDLCDVYIIQHSIVEGQAVNIGLDEPVKCQLEATYYRHFVLVSCNTLDDAVCSLYTYWEGVCCVYNII